MSDTYDSLMANETRSHALSLVAYLTQHDTKLAAAVKAFESCFVNDKLDQPEFAHNASALLDDEVHRVIHNQSTDTLRTLACAYLRNELDAPLRSALCAALFPNEIKAAMERLS